MLRWLFGYASFEVSGGYPEKFINFTVKYNINTWDLKKESGNLTGKVIASQYKMLRKPARNANSRIRLKSKKGLPFVTFGYRKRKGLIVGAVVFAFILWLFSMYVWNINVTGNETIPTADIIAAAAEVGVAPGTLKSKIVPASVEHMIMIKMEGIAWMSVNINGSCVSIDIKEKVNIPEIVVSDGEPCNIVASRDGQIERMETYCGTPVASVGDVVTKGQLLVSGVVENADFKSSFLSAQCNTFAKTQYEISEKIKFSSPKAVDTGKRLKRLRIRFLGIEIPLWARGKIDDNFRCETSSRFLNVFSVQLPIKIHEEIWYEQKCLEIALSQAEAHSLAEKSISEKETLTLKNCRILEKTVSEEKTDSEYIMHATYICLENISKKEKILFE